MHEVAGAFDDHGVKMCPIAVVPCRRRRCRRCPDDERRELRRLRA